MGWFGELLLGGFVYGVGVVSGGLESCLDKVVGVVRVVCRSGLEKVVGVVGVVWRTKLGLLGWFVEVFWRKLYVLFEFLGWFEVTELFRSMELLIRC